ncbi:MAG: hypothetical protein V1707_01845 [bacterium]
MDIPLLSGQCVELGFYAHGIHLSIAVDQFSLCWQEFVTISFTPILLLVSKFG